MKIGITNSLQSFLFNVWSGTELAGHTKYFGFGNNSYKQHHKIQVEWTLEK
jgi:hypothetical protein